MQRLIRMTVFPIKYKEKNLVVDRLRHFLQLLKRHSEAGNRLINFHKFCEQVTSYTAFRNAAPWRNVPLTPVHLVFVRNAAQIAEPDLNQFFLRRTDWEIPYA